ncbi:hypothetical protein [Legionella genomosp. 1]|uniref:hypothetical protein n=1 Tax=Legionella genomosp. 1 TaxID=1093625 RepID=UPI0010552834|nr:hypothetical protein [Legionella genomosp. 1]
MRAINIYLIGKQTSCIAILWLHCAFACAVNPSAASVTVTVPALVQISGLSNITLSPINLSSPVTGNTTACIYTNTISPLGSYFVTATSANAASGTFRVVNGSNFITYNAYWNPGSAPSQTITLVSGVKTAQQTGGSSTSLTCGGTPNANFNIRITSSQVAGAPAAVYTDTVTLLISPS